LEEKMSEKREVKKTLDTVGLFCPEPLFRAREEIDKVEVGDVLEILADDPAAEEDLTRFAKRAGHRVVSVEKDGDVLRILIERGT
jgi:TusA-related sulfurtransferase